MRLCACKRPPNSLPGEAPPTLEGRARGACPLHPLSCSPSPFPRDPTRFGDKTPGGSCPRARAQVSVRAPRGASVDRVRLSLERPVHSTCASVLKG